MINTWTKGLTDEEKTELKSSYAAAAELRARMVFMLEDLMMRTEVKKRSEDLYNCPNWQYLQADFNGHNRAIQKVISLIKDEIKK